MATLVSEVIVPRGGAFDVGAMARGEPGLPGAFQWRSRTYGVVQVIERWTHSEREGGRQTGGLYLRRHGYRLRMSDDSVWTVYFLRQTPRSGSPKRRWFLYAVERSCSPVTG